MTKTSKLLSAAVAAAIVALPAIGQTNDTFDLSSQRSEKQSVNPAPGHYVSDRPFIVNPIPQDFTLGKAGVLSVGNGFTLKGKSSKAFSADCSSLTLSAKGAPLTLTDDKKAADKAGVKDVSGAYVLTVDKNGVTIIGRDARGVFYGIQTLRQLLENPGMEKALPELTINDYPTLPKRGVVEGFYGNPWSHEVRLSLIDFYGRHKMNTYFYAPKDDPYHSSPNWRLPYPEKEAQNIRELAEASRRNHVDFVWAIHPGKDIKWNEEDYQNLINKFKMMYDLGVRSFAIFFDDIEGEGTNPVRQAELMNRITEDFIKKHPDVSGLVACPTDYSRMWANPTENGALATWGRLLDPSVEVMNTGDVVCSDLTRESQEFFSNLTRRPGYYWWNWPVTDYGRMYLMQGPAYGLDTTLTADDICAIVSNPMEHGEASKLGLYGVADYAWNTSDYNPIDNWERGLRELAPNTYDAYRRFAIHSTDTETGYRRDESWETTIPTLDLTKSPAVYNALKEEFEAISKVPAQLENGMGNQLLLNELRPWLVEFGKLGDRGLRTIELIDMSSKGASPEEFWNVYTANLMSPEDAQAYNAHKSGTMKLQPFYEESMGTLAADFYNRLTGKTPKIYDGIGTFRNLSTTLDRNMLDGDTATFYTSAYAQKKGDWIGVLMPETTAVSEVHIRQGRNSVDDVDFFDLAVVEYSADGKEWKALTDTLTNTYDIVWTSEPVDARIVRLRRLDDSKRRNWASVRTFEVNPPRLENLGFTITAPNAEAMLTAFDSNPLTMAKLDGNVTIE
ncbi:MAG: beta-N-acetylglucosaminidase domain-containing protein, partial [Muribaculaceae bacterium]|nr:beta-N-acetylglucosaminidase domain-containing protein [Muribaculaceae bacterium]